MARQATGTLRFRGGAYHAQFTLSKSSRPSFVLSTCTTEDGAKARMALMSDLLTRLRAAGHGDLAVGFLERVATRDGKALADVVEAANRVVHGTVERVPNPSVITFKDFATDWTEGRLRERWPDQVKLKRSVDSDRIRLKKHVYPNVGHVPIVEFKLDDADALMRALPTSLTSTSRRHIAQLLHRILGLAVYPARLIPTHPLPKGFLPPIGATKALTYLYPDEDATLLRSSDVPIGRRLLYGVLAREGLRRGEAEKLTWADIDLARGALTLDTNKTDDPRAWALDPSVARALAAWKKRLGGRATDNTRVFVEPSGEHVELERAAEQLRSDLNAAGVSRAVLYEQSATRQPVRVHDLRATFVTVSLSNGRNEGWVMDRTGHTTPHMLHRYRRAARTLAELGQGDFMPLDVAIPELTAVAPKERQTVQQSVREELNSPTTERRKHLETRGVGHDGLEPSTNGLRIRTPRRNWAFLKGFVRGMRRIETVGAIAARLTTSSKRCGGHRFRPRTRPTPMRCAADRLRRHPIS